MSILPNSRYANSKTLTVTTPATFGSVDASVIVPGIQKPFTFRYVSHLVVIGDRIDTVTAQYYGDATMWWRIADANPAIMYWDDLAPGTVLRVPVL